jgi:hypothetical protein
VLLNWKFAQHPSNWVIVFLMLLIAGVGGHLLLNYLGIEPNTAGS